MKKLLELTCILTVITISLLSFQRTRAEDIQSASDRATVVPAKFELWGKAGETLTQTIKITNEDTQDAIIALSVQGFGVFGENGEVSLDESYATNPGQLARWITFDQKSSQYAAKETKLINFKINIPKDAKPGGQYASIVVGMDRVNRMVKESGATARVVSLLMLDIAGDNQEKASVISFKAVKNSTTSYDFILRSQNFGNSHVKPKGKIVIANIWGTKIDEIELNSENILPNVTRRMVSTWEPSKNLAGLYTATMIADYGSKGDKKLTASTGFYVLPIWFIAIIILILIIFGFLVGRLIKMIRNKFRIK